MEKNEQQMNFSGRLKGGLFGFVLILAGTLFLAFNFGWIDPALRSVVFSWPVLFVVFAFIALFKREYPALLFWLVLAAFFLLPRIARSYPDALPGINEDFTATFWPVLLIVVGAGVLVKLLFLEKNGRHRHGHVQRSFHVDEMEGASGVYVREVVFGGIEDIFLEPMFRGGQIEVVFGGVELDLRRASLPEGDTYLRVEAVFGGIKLYLPDDWMVVPKITTVLGGVDNKHFSKSANHDTSRRLLISGEVVFGGFEIR